MIQRLFILSLVVLTGCVVQRSVVRQPALDLYVTGGSVPLADVSVYLFWKSNPYNTLEETRTFATDANGRLKLEEILQLESSYPLLMHGVKFFEHELCLETPSYQTLIVNVKLEPGEKLTLSAPLTVGESPNVCSNYEELTRRVAVMQTRLRPDITGQHSTITGAYEVTP
jgi:hypothetical protein